MKERVPNISVMLIVTVFVVLLSGGCLLGVFYGYRPGVLAITEESGLLGIYAAVTILVVCRFIVQASLLLLGILWLAYIGWLIIVNQKGEVV